MEAKEQFSDGGIQIGLINYCASQVTDEQLAGAISGMYNSQSLKRIFTDPSLISTILKLVQHIRGSGFQSGKKIKIKRKSKWAHVKADTEIAKVG
jgi:asparagine synthase (glutamine-hydrolysing)